METIAMKDGVASSEVKNGVSSTSVVQKTSPSTTCSNCKPPKITKQLIPLKLALFSWYGGASVLQIFLPIYLKQLGLSVQQLSLIYIAAPVVQFLGPAVSGFIADKIGRSKPVLYANIALALIFVNAMLLIPNINQSLCIEPQIKLNCSSTIITTNGESVFNRTTFLKLVDMNVTFCDVLCPARDLSIGSFEPNNVNPFNGSIQTFQRNKRSFEYSSQNNGLKNYAVLLNGTLESMDLNLSRCETNFQCNLKCFKGNDLECNINDRDNSMFVFVLSFILIIFYNCTFSNCYRFMDVTCMVMVKKYNSDFGRERLWAILSIIVLSPLSGYLVKLTATESGPENYASAIYFFDATTLITVLTIIKLDVEVNPPGKHLWKKTLSLAKNLDVLAFAFVLLILGTSWCFTKFYSSLFLHQLKAPSILLGLLPAISGLSGLPFLATSNWWVERLGSNNLLVAGLVCYTLLCVSYSYLINPWYALIYETLGVFTYHLGWVAVIRHSHEIAPNGLTAFTIASAGGLHYGVGKGTGSAVGLIMGRYGGVTAYRFVACMCGITAALYLAYRYFRSRSQSALTPRSQV